MAVVVLRLVDPLNLFGMNQNLHPTGSLRAISLI
jgi:hypothetical protein